MGRPTSEQRQITMSVTAMSVTTMSVTAMSFNIEEVGADRFPEYGAVPNWFEVRRVFRVDVVDGGLRGFGLVEEPVAERFIRDYDDHHEDSPTVWARDFDVSRWGILLACEGGRPVGAAAVTPDAPVYPMDRFQREDLAVLWDICVRPEHRRRGIGFRLFRPALYWAWATRCGQMDLETDSGNVAACRFYAGQGCDSSCFIRRNLHPQP